MKHKGHPYAFGIVALCLAAMPAGAQELFSGLVGPVQVEPVAWKPGAVLDVPYITWGGDVATFHANGGTDPTKTGTIFQQSGLKLRLTAGDDFVGQVKNYLSGKTPFLRGTLRMIGMASEVVGADPRTKPVVFLQLTWSQGDHMVGRSNVKTADDLKGKKIVLQQGGPHVGMLDDILKSTQLTWKDIQAIWTTELTGDEGPAARFRKDASIDVCMAISPDMLGLTSGLEATGTGAEGTVKGAHVVVSTATMNRSIADVYACRKDFYDANRGVVEKFAAGYLKACEAVTAMKATYEKQGKAAAPDYMALLALTQKIYGPEVIPTAEVDAHGLIADCEFVHLRGNRLFFTASGFQQGFEAKQREAMDLAVKQGYAKKPSEFIRHDLDFRNLIRLGGLTKTELGESPVFRPIDGVGGSGDAILSFTIQFAPNQVTFPVAQYESEFARVVESASLYGNAVFAIRGHSDPNETLRSLVVAGMQSGIIKRTGVRRKYKYFLNGKPLDLTQTARIVALIQGGAFSGLSPDPSQTMQSALNLSQARAEEVRKEIVRYAASKQYRLNATQLQAVGVGIAEPVIKRPRGPRDAAENRRVEFRLVPVQAESTAVGEFDF